MNIKKLNQLDSFMNERLEKKSVMGASLLVEHKGKRVYENFFGTDRKDSIYKLFDLTMPITSVATMILFERGDIDLLAPVGSFLQGFSDCKVATETGMKKAESPILIRDLLNMTSGIVGCGDYGIPEQSMTKTYREAKTQSLSGILKSTADVCNKFGEACLAFEPGTGFHYGFSSDVLGAVLEVITGKSLSEFLKEDMFQTLNMEDTDFLIDPNKSLRQAILYRRNRNGRLVRGEDDVRQKFDMDSPFKNPWYESAGTGLYSTLEDYAHFAQMLLNRGSYHGKELIGRKTMDFMTTPNVKSEAVAASMHITRPGLGYSYGNLFNILTNSSDACTNATEGEISYSGLCGSFFIVDPAEDLIVILLQQVDQGADEGFIRRIKQIVYGTL